MVFSGPGQGRVGTADDMPGVSVHSDVEDHETVTQCTVCMDRKRRFFDLTGAAVGYIKNASGETLH